MRSRWPRAFTSLELKSFAAVGGSAGGLSAQWSPSDVRTFTLLPFAHSNGADTTYKAQLPVARGLGRTGLIHGVSVDMFAALNLRHLALVRYAVFNGVLFVGAAAIAGQIADLALSIKMEQTVVARAEPSRVEKFKRDEVAAALAPQVPVLRQVVALSVPDMPVQVLALRLDQAETIKVRPIKVKRKTAVRVAKATPRPRKPPGIFGDLPAVVVETALVETGSLPPKLVKKRAVIAESSRDITNRSLGVLVALKN